MAPIKGRDSLADEKLVVGFYLSLTVKPPFLARAMKLQLSEGGGITFVDGRWVI